MNVLESLAPCLIASNHAKRLEKTCGRVERKIGNRREVDDVGLHAIDGNVGRASLLADDREHFFRQIDGENTVPRLCKENAEPTRPTAQIDDSAWREKVLMRECHIAGQKRRI